MGWLKLATHVKIAFRYSDGYRKNSSTAETYSSAWKTVSKW